MPPRHLSRLISRLPGLVQYPEVDWKGAKGMRDIISHHYFDIDADEIFWVCEYKMKPLAKTITKIINDIRNGYCKHR